MNTAFARAYAQVIEKKAKRSPTWNDVQLAYDAGLKHGVLTNLTNRRKVLRILEAVQVLNAHAAEDALLLQDAE